jgi:hypothetical protein
MVPFPTGTELVARCRWLRGDKDAAKEAYARLILLDPTNTAAITALSMPQISPP